MLVGALALIREALGLEDGHASVRNAFLGDVGLELKETDEAVEAADYPARGFLPGKCEASSTTSSGPT